METSLQRNSRIWVLGVTFCLSLHENKMVRCPRSRARFSPISLQETAYKKLNSLIVKKFRNSRAGKILLTKLFI